MNPNHAYGQPPQNYGQPPQNYGQPQQYNQPQHIANQNQPQPHGSASQNAPGSPYGKPAAPMGQPTQWSTRFVQTSDPVTCSDIMLGCIVGPCGIAYAKTLADGSNCCVNLACFSPCFNYQYIRLQYGINGSCGDDCAYGSMCCCCQNKQGVSETRMRGKLPNAAHYGTHTRDWSHSLFDCGCCELCHVCCCTVCVAHDIRKRLQPRDDSCCFDTCCMNPLGMYSQTRVSYGILTDLPCLEDFFVPIFCCACALNRANKESRKYPNPSRLPS